MSQTKKFSVREVISLARRLGWSVILKKGMVSYIDTEGNKFTSRAPGRADRVPLRLAKALSK